MNNISLFVISILILCCCFPRIRGQNYTTPQLVDNNCTSASFSSLVFPSTAPPWAFDWRITIGNDAAVTLVSVTVQADPTLPLGVTNGISSFSNRYVISNSPDPILTTSTPFLSTVTIFNITADENFTLSVPGLQSEPFSKSQCPLTVNELTNSISCSTTPCTCDSIVTLFCKNGDQVVTTCPFSGTIVNTCPEEGGLSPGEIAGICIGVIVGVVGLGALVYYLWLKLCKKQKKKTKDKETGAANDPKNNGQNGGKNETIVEEPVAAKNNEQNGQKKETKDEETGVANVTKNNGQNGRKTNTEDKETGAGNETMNNKQNGPETLEIPHVPDKVEQTKPETSPKPHGSEKEKQNK